MTQKIVKAFIIQIKKCYKLASSAMATTTEDKSKQPLELMHKVPHCQQRHSWDCGVSCVMMLLEEPQRQHFLQNFSAICSEEGFNQSTWTIDLCYLLKRFGIKHTMYTTMPGVNEDYKKHSYYNKILDLDRERVRRRFACAARSGIAVERRALRMRDVVAHVLRSGPAILLVDSARLSCSCCRGDSLAAQFRLWLNMGGYRGHYVLVVGVRGGRVLYRDPARAGAGAACGARVAALRAAARAPGTDHDAILVHRTYA